jgi:hypothetical protein
MTRRRHPVTGAPEIPALLLETWSVYEQHDRMVDAAAAAGVSFAMFKKRLRELYTILGVKSSQQAGRVLRERGLVGII